MRRISWLLAALVLAGCAADRVEVARVPSAYCPAPPPIPANAQGVLLPPAIVTANAPDWETVFAYQLRFSLAAPSTLAGKGPETAQALARLVMLGSSFAHSLRFQMLPGSAWLDMQQAMSTLRAMLGTGPGVSDGQLARALLAAECALWVGDRGGARSALAEVGSAADALDLIAPPGADTPPHIPRAIATAAASAAPAIEAQGADSGVVWPGR